MNFSSRFEAPVSCRSVQLFTFVLTLLCGVVPLSAQNIINTIAGGGTLPPFSTPATGNYADIPGPTSVVADQQGDLYIASPNSQQIYKVDPTGTTLSVYGGEGWSVEDSRKYDGDPAISAYFNSPTGLAIDSVGNLYIADTQAYEIQQISPGGIFNTVAGSGDYCNTPPSCEDGPALGAYLADPSGVGTDAAGNVYIADTNDNEIRAVNMQSTSITVFGVTIKPGYIARIAGSGTQCPSPTSPCGDNGPALKAQLNGPLGVAIDHLGNMFIADSGDRRIRVVIPSGVIVAYAGNGNPCYGGPCGDSGPSTSAQLSNPWQIYVDSSDNLYIADSPTNRIREVTPGKNPPTTATISTVVGTGQACTTAHIISNFCGDTGPATSAQLNAPRGITLDSSGNYYIADSGDQRIRKVSSGNINTYAGGGLGDGPASTAIFAANRDVAVDNVGDVFVADTGNNRIRKISGGNVSTLAGNGIGAYFGNGVLAVNANLNQPWGLTVDSSGNVYVADSNNLVVRVINTQSSPITVAGVVIQPGTIGTVAGTANTSCGLQPPLSCGDGGPATQATFNFPSDVTLDSHGNFFVTDLGANVIREVNTSGIISTVAGNLQLGPCTDPAAGACGDGGPATTAQLAQPHSAAVDSTGDIYIADTGDNRIRVVNNSGTINAFAFNGLAASFGPDGVAALSSGYTQPQYVALDSGDNLFVSGSSIYYVVQRIDASTNPIVNPVASVAGRYTDPKYFGFCCDGTAALGAYLNNFGVAVDSSENLYIADGGNNRVREVSSSSTQGLVPTVKVSPSSLTFSAAAIGVQSAPQNFTVTNTGSDDLVMGTPSITGPFNYVSQSPCYGNIVPPDTSCTYSVTFTPTGYGAEKGTATVYDNAFGSPSQTVKLSGSGPDFTIAANPSSLTIAPGNQGNSTITLTPEAGFSQSITLSCADLPAGGTTCAYSPNPVGMNGSTASTSTLTVTVGSGTASGTYTIYVKGSSVITHTTPITLTVP